jgi:hypothetical protein
VDTTASATRGKGANCAEVMAGDGGTSTFGSKDVNPIISVSGLSKFIFITILLNLYNICI